MGKKITPLQVFFAQRWLPLVWFVPITISFGYFGAIMSFEYAQDHQFHFLYVLLIPVHITAAALMGFFIAILTYVFPLTILMHPFVSFRERINGAPFNVGDQIRIIAGPYRNRVTRICS
ncbi:MAG: hypothetical protein BWY76_00157 [bacterium ADurb.Bin429]|nr:MAG: hypothetical protein BWY76_00157 [bacterium ADurb.Bin429]